MPKVTRRRAKSDPSTCQKWPRRRAKSDPSTCQKWPVDVPKVTLAVSRFILRRRFICPGSFWHVDGPGSDMPSLHSLRAATVFYCGTAKCQCCHELQIWMNIESAWLLSWLLKQNRDPTWYDMYLIMVQFPCSYMWICMVWPISQHIWSCCADQHVLIVILRYMYMLWLFNSWVNNGVSA